MNYYNEFDPRAAAWLRQLIADGLIPAGDVDERSIEDVRPQDLAGYTQHHFFAGIGGWSHALALAGWDASRPVATGSCPCQPFSSAGKGIGFADERHLWPAFFHLIRQCKFPVVFGEQVAKRAGLSWLDLVSTDLEAAGYTFGAADLCAAGVGAPHIRQRLYWVGIANGSGCEPWNMDAATTGRDLRGAIVAAGGTDGGMGNACGSGLSGHGRLEQIAVQDGREGASRHGSANGLDGGMGQPYSSGRIEGSSAPKAMGHGSSFVPTNWADCDWVKCETGVLRPVERGTSPMAPGLPRELGRVSDPSAPMHPSEARVTRIKGYGNAIVPEVAATFIQSTGLV